MLSVAASACSNGGGSSLPPVTSAAPTAPALTNGVERSVADAGNMSGSSGELALSADSLPGDHDANDNFIDSIGVNTKLDVPDGVYTNFNAVKAGLLGLGVRHIRDTFSTQNTSQYEAKLADLADSGIRSALGLTITPGAQNEARVNVGGAKAAAYLQAGHYLRSIEAVEGINEPDVNQAAPTGPSPQGWVRVTQSEQRALYDGVRALTAPAKRLPVYGPSVAIKHLSDVGDLSAAMDYGNVHDYSGGYDLPGSTIADVVTSERSLSGGNPVVATENGYSTGTTGQAVPDDIQLDYAQRLFFKQFTHGIKRTSWYELLDESNQQNDYWRKAGLLRSDFSPKPAYTGMKNIIALLSDRTAYRPRTRLNFSFGNQAQFENIEHLLLQKNDGSFWLIVWRDIDEWNPAGNGSSGSYPDPKPAVIPNSLNFLGTYVASVTKYEEDYTGAMHSFPIAVSSGSMAQIAIAPRPRIFKIVPGAAPAAAAAPRVGGAVAHWSLDEGEGTLAADALNARADMRVEDSGKISWVTGRYGPALAFNGTQAASTAHVLDTSRSYSVTAWLQLGALSGYQAAIAVNGARQSAFALGYTPASNLCFTTYTRDSASTALARIGSNVAPVVGRWYAVAATYDAATHGTAFYVDGVMQSSGHAYSTFDGTHGIQLGSLLQGGVGHYQWWSGGVDEVNFYQRVLDRAEIAVLAGR